MSRTELDREEILSYGMQLMSALLENLITIQNWNWKKFWELKSKRSSIFEVRNRWCCLKKKLCYMIKNSSYTNPASQRPVSTLTWVVNSENYLDPERRDDVMT
jgi:hypothetical protein